MNSQITASIVLYNNKIEDLLLLLNSISRFSSIKVYLIDNSPTNKLSTVSNDNIHYIHNPANPGFGAAHNIAIMKAIHNKTRYHFIINPDIKIKDDIFTPMIKYIKDNPEVGMIMPRILNEDGTIQNLPKLLPNVWWIFRRKLKKVYPSKKFINMYELRSAPKDQIYNVPILSGCFTLLSLDAIKEVGMYDERFFMYFEDFDLSRRVHQKYKTVYFPKVSVVHGYEGGANKSLKLFKVFIKSMILYFNKWGWFFDKERINFNKATLIQFNSYLN